MTVILSCATVGDSQDASVQFAAWALQGASAPDGGGEDDALRETAEPQEPHHEAPMDEEEEEEDGVEFDEDAAAFFAAAAARQLKRTWGCAAGRAAGSCTHPRSPFARNRRRGPHS